jgi:pimeloyl-ACP methyl ester carboxylesterase
MKLTFLLLRGLSRQQAHWGTFPKQLASAFSKQGIQADFFFEDLPGFGERFQQKSPASIEGIADILAQRLEQIPGKLQLIGISMGGMLALELAKRYPHKCQSLAMINSSVKPAASFYQRLQPRAYPAFLKAWFYPFRQASEQQILNISTEKYQNDPALLDTWLYYRQSQPPSRVAAFKQILAAARYQAPSVKPLKHVLLIASRHDKIASYRCTQQLADYWGLTPLIHPDAGHDLPLDAPEWLVEQLVSWYVSKLYKAK